MSSPDSTPTPVVVTECADYGPNTVDAAVRRAVDLLGGIARFVHPGQTVLLKPNLLSARPPEQAVTTHPELVRALAVLCREAGAARVWIGDSPAGMHSEAILWEKTGMAVAAELAGAELKSFEDAVTPMPVGEDALPVPSWFSEVDVLISLPKLKTHGLTTMTCAMKNLFGLACGEAKAMCHARHPSPAAMSRFLADWYVQVKPALTVVDAVVAMEGEGPANGTPRPVGVLLAAADAVAVDAVCVRTLGLNPESVPMLKRARETGAGETRLAHIELLGDGLARLAAVRLKQPDTRLLRYIPESLFQLVSRLLRFRPAIDQKLCVACGICIGICPRRAIRARADHSQRPNTVNERACILCLCCVEACPRHAIRIRSPLDLWNRIAGRARGRM